VLELSRKRGLLGPPEAATGSDEARGGAGDADSATAESPRVRP